MTEFTLKGIIPPMVTPLLGDDTLDVDGLENLIEHLITGGVHGLFILGTTGEGPSLSYALRGDLIERVCSQVDGRVPVLVGITDTSFRESISMADKARKAGASAVVLAPPFYFNIDKNELHQYANRLIDEVSLPVVLYNMPALTKINFDFDTVNKLAERPEVVGFKDSSADMIYFHKMNRIKNRTHISLFTGPEELLMETLLMGGDGGVPGGANMFPELYVNLYQAVQKGDIEETWTLHKKIMELSAVVYHGSEYSSGRIISGIKKALYYLNICSDYTAQPFGAVEEAKAEKIKDFIKNNH